MLMAASDRLTLENIGSFLEKLAEKSESVYWLSSPDFTKIQYVSPAYEKIWGRPREVLYKNPEVWITYLHPEDAENYNPIQAMAERVSQDGKEARYEEDYRILRPDGEIRWIVDRGFPVYDQNGKCCGVTGVAVDITSDKIAEELLRKEKEKAEIANKAKSDFIANMSHDIRTPITGIVGMIQDLLNTAYDTDSSLKKNKAISSTALLTKIKKLIQYVENNCHVLKDAVDQLLKLLNEILEVTRLDHGLVPKKSESFNIHDLVTDNIELLSPIAKNKKLDLRVEFSEHIPKYLTGLREYTNRTLLNLLSNALKFTKKGQVKLKINVKGKFKNLKIGDPINIQFIIKDTGIGIPENKFDVIFGHFSRLTPSYKGLYQGSGLGLYTVKRYIEAMEGEISLKSKVKVGSTFTVTLPFTVSNKITKSTNKQIKHGKNIDFDTLFKESESIQSSTSHVLVVEDNLPAAMAVKIALQPFKCKLDFAENGKEAIKKANSKNYNLILMDIGLPDIGGIEVTKKIRGFKNTRKSKVPIVALTGHADNPEMRQQCFNAGMQEVLSKPTQTLILEPIFKKLVLNTSKKKENKPKENKQYKTLNKDSIDWQGCLDIYQGNQKSSLQLLFMLSKDLESTLDILKNHYNTKNHKALNAELHRILGGVAYLKVPNLEKTLKDFQAAVKTKPLNFNELASPYKSFKKAINEFQKEIKKLNVK